MYNTKAAYNNDNQSHVIQVYACLLHVCVCVTVVIHIATILGDFINTYRTREIFGGENFGEPCRLKLLARKNLANE